MKPLTGTSKNLLCDPIAALGGARSLAYLLDMSRSLRSVRLALGPLATVFRGALTRFFTLTLFIGLVSHQALAESLTIAAAADLKYAMAEVVKNFRAHRPDDKIEVIYGSSGKFFTQIYNGAPFDMYFSADIEYPYKLEKQGLTAGPTRRYAVGRIVLWSSRPELAKMPLKDLPGAALRKFAIANPQHAPYGRRAQEAMQHEGIWGAMQPKLVLGENIAHTAQFIDSGAADAGIIALSLALSPNMQGKGTWTLIPDAWHNPLEQGFVITHRAAANRLAKDFTGYMASEPARVVMRRYGFVLPGEK